ARVVRVLVRLHGAPVGWIYIHEPGDVVTAEQLRSALVRQLGDAAQRALLRARIDPRRAPPAAPPVSVVVCTRDRPRPLERCLTSLVAACYAGVEIIVIDSASATTETAQVVASFAGDHPVRYLREEQPGLDRARNRGLAEARHGIVAFTDDDVRVD